MKINKWTDYEDMVLSLTVTNMKKNGYTYKQAFKMITEKISRSESACRSRWYRKVKELTTQILSASMTPKVESRNKKNKNIVLVNVAKEVVNI